MLQNAYRDEFLFFGSFAKQAQGIIQDTKLGPDNPAVIAVTATVNLLDTIPTNPPLDGLARAIGGTQPALVIGIIPTLTQTLTIYSALLTAQPTPTQAEEALQTIYLEGNSPGLVVGQTKILVSKRLLALIATRLGTKTFRGQVKLLLDAIIDLLNLRTPSGLSILSARNRSDLDALLGRVQAAAGRRHVPSITGGKLYKGLDVRTLAYVK